MSDPFLEETKTTGVRRETSNDAPYGWNELFLAWNVDGERWRFTVRREISYDKEGRRTFGEWQFSANRKETP